MAWRDGAWRDGAVLGNARQDKVFNKQQSREMTQPSLFDHIVTTTYQPPTDPHVDPSDVSRLTGQNAAILARLERGPATNDELSRISRKYTSRISDVRAWLLRHGKTITCEHGTGGLNTYRIEKQ